MYREDAMTAAIEKAKSIKGPWNADREVATIRKWASKDGSGDADEMDWGKYGKAFAIIKGGGDGFGDFGFPHHGVRDGKLLIHRKGLGTAWQAARGSRTGKPNKKAQAHLRPHVTAEFGKPKPKKSIVHDDALVPGYLARVQDQDSDKPLHLIVRDDEKNPRHWDPDSFIPAIKELAENLGSPGAVDIEFNADDKDADGVCDLVVKCDGGMYLSNATPAVFTISTDPPGVLVLSRGRRVMIDGGGVDPDRDLDAWLVTSESRSDFADVVALGIKNGGVRVHAGEYYRDNLSVSLRTDVTPKPSAHNPDPKQLDPPITAGYSIYTDSGHVAWIPVLNGAVPDWAYHADLLVVGKLETDKETFDVSLKESRVSQVVFVSDLEEGAMIIPNRVVKEKPKVEQPVAKTETDDDDVMMDMQIVAKAKESRYTFGVCYRATESKDSPDLDAHGEYIMMDDLQKAQWGYVKTGDRRIYLQHGSHGIVPVGEWVDMVAWPMEVEAKLTLPGKTGKVSTIPAGSIWMGVIWNDIGWPLVRDGQLRGFSLGGFRRR